MFIKGEAEILEKLRQRIANGEDLLFKPEKEGSLVYAAILLPFGLYFIFQFNKLFMLSLGGLFIITAILLICPLFTKDGLLILDANGLKFYQHNKPEHYSWEQVMRLSIWQTKSISYVFLLVRHKKYVRIGIYPYEGIEFQTLQKLIDSLVIWGSFGDAPSQGSLDDPNGSRDNQ
jgi:hypothetical protein